MKNFEFNPFGTKSIIIRFDCDKCSQQVESEEIELPSPSYLADTHSDSQSETHDYTVCPHCGKEFNITIFVGYCGGDGDVGELPNFYDDIYVEEIPEPYYEDEYEAIITNSEYLETFNQNLNDILQLLEVKLADPSLVKVFYRQLYVSVIGTMETYLSDAFINTVFKSKNNLKKFFKSFKNFDNQKIPVSKLYDFEENAEKYARKALIDVIYHHLPKVSNMYKSTFGIEFPEIEEIQKAILKRHDFVHRNGKDKEGNEVRIDSLEVQSLVNEIRNFISEIDDKLIEKAS